MRRNLATLVAALAGLLAVYLGWRIIFIAQQDENELEAFLHDRENVPDAPVYLRAGHLNKVASTP
jgi:hypothetical protein